MSDFVNVVARHAWMITMLICKGEEMLTCCVVVSQPDAGDLLRFFVDGQFSVVDALDVCTDELPEDEQGRCVVVCVVGCEGCLAIGSDQEAVDDKDAIFKKPR